MKKSRHSLFLQNTKTDSLDSQLASFLNFLKCQYGLLGIGCPLHNNELMALDGVLVNVGLYLLIVEPGMDDVAWGNAISEWKADQKNKTM